MSKSVGVNSLTDLSGMLIARFEELFRKNCFVEFEAVLRDFMDRGNPGVSFVADYRVHGMEKERYAARWVGKFIELTPAMGRIGAQSFPPEVVLGLSDGVPNTACPACSGGGCALNSFGNAIKGLPDFSTEMNERLANSLRSLMEGGKLDLLVADLRDRLRNFAPKPVYTYEIGFYSRCYVSTERNDIHGARPIRCFLSRLGLPIPTGASSRVALGPEPVMTPGLACDVCWGTGVSTTGHKASLRG